MPHRSLSECAHAARPFAQAHAKFLEKSKHRLSNLAHVFFAYKQVRVSAVTLFCCWSLVIGVPFRVLIACLVFTALSWCRLWGFMCCFTCHPFLQALSRLFALTKADTLSLPPPLPLALTHTHTYTRMYAHTAFLLRRPGMRVLALPKMCTRRPRVTSVRPSSAYMTC